MNARSTTACLVAFAWCFLGCSTPSPLDGGRGTGGGGGAANGGGGGTATGGSAGDGGQTFDVTTTVGPLDAPDAGEEMKVTREFNCRPEAVGAEAWITEVDGATDESLAIRPAPEPCSFHLFHRAGTVSTQVSTQPSAYLIAQARRFVDGVRLVCASEVATSQVGTSLVTRRVDGVNVRCWASGTTSFQSTRLVVQGGADWAAWVRSLEPSPTQSGVYLVRWTRDFTFSFLNMGDRGRPATDGVYETQLSWDGSTLSAAPPTLLSPVTNPFAGSPQTPWHPTRDELDTLGQYLPFDPDLDAGP